MSFQATEADLNETEEYKEAQTILDSVKLDVWFQTHLWPHSKIHLNLISFLLPEPVFLIVSYYNVSTNSTHVVFDAVGLHIHLQSGNISFIDSGDWVGGPLFIEMTWLSLWKLFSGLT